MTVSVACRLMMVLGWMSVTDAVMQIGVGTVLSTGISMKHPAGISIQVGAPPPRLREMQNSLGPIWRLRVPVCVGWITVMVSVASCLPMIVFKASRFAGMPSVGHWTSGIVLSKLRLMKQPAGMEMQAGGPPPRPRNTQCSAGPNFCSGEEMVAAGMDTGVLEVMDAGVDTSVDVGGRAVSCRFSIFDAAVPPSSHCTVGTVLSSGTSMKHPVGISIQVGGPPPRPSATQCSAGPNFCSGAETVAGGVDTGVADTGADEVIGTGLDTRVDVGGRAVSCRFSILLDVTAPVSSH